MSKIVKIIFGCLFLIVIIIISAVSFFYFATKTSKSGQLKLAGLESSVTIYTNQKGVSHIEAQNDNDAFFALGFIHAQDRFWQMEFQRHIAQGTLSEMFGEATINQDKFLRTLGFYRAAKTAWPALSPRTQAIIHSYTLGVNAFITNGKLPLPFQLINYKPTLWNDVDSIAWQKLMAWDLQDTWEKKIINQLVVDNFGKDQLAVLFPVYPQNAPTIVTTKNYSAKQKPVTASETQPPQLAKANVNNKQLTTALSQLLLKNNALKTALGFDDMPGKGSNSWAIAGRLTQSGKPMLASDPHLALAAPVLWYLADIKTPNFHSIGATIPGLPAIVIGHNDYIAWGITNPCVDAQDIYIEPADAKVTTINEVIHVKGKSDVNYPVKSTIHGPIISEVSKADKLGKLVALKWVASAPGDTTLESFYS